MPGETLDAYLTFTKGIAGRGSAPEIRGETKDATEKSGGWYSMQIKSYNFTFELDTSATEETPNNKGETLAHHPQFTPVQVTKIVDIASPFLLAALCLGAKYDKVWISQRKSGAVKGATGDYFWELELREVMVKNLTWNAADDGIPVETITLEYQGISAWYSPQNRTGELALDKAVEYDYDLQSADPGDKKNKTAPLSDSDVNGIVKKVLAIVAKSYPNVKVPVK